MKGFVSVMKEKIINASIESLRREGLKFSVDALAEKLKISKKTVYKYFPDKQALAEAIYEKYYSDAIFKAKALVNEGTDEAHRELLKIYFDSKYMTRNSIFNKYKLNQMIYAYTAKKSDELWDVIAESFLNIDTDMEKNALRFIVDGSFEKLCSIGASPDDVFGKLVDFLW
ncbi:MAG: TetR/AcrR family transcriptional regulator [Eubacterium sp.]